MRVHLRVEERDMTMAATKAPQMDDYLADLSVVMTVEKTAAEKVR